MASRLCLSFQFTCAAIAMFAVTGCAPKSPAWNYSQSAHIGHTVYRISIDDGHEVDTYELLVSSSAEADRNRTYPAVTLRPPSALKNAQGEVICTSESMPHRTQPHWLDITLRKPGTTITSSGNGALSINATKYTFVPTTEMIDRVNPESPDFDCDQWRPWAGDHYDNLVQFVELIRFFYTTEPLASLEPGLKKGTGWTPEQLGFAAMSGELEIPVIDRPMTAEEETLIQQFGPGPFRAIRLTVRVNSTPLMEFDLLLGPDIWELQSLAGILRASIHPVGDLSRQIVFELMESEAVPGYMSRDGELYWGTPGDFTRIEVTPADQVTGVMVPPGSE
ncbi:MAG: hypothetical protein MK116_01885 [Phycisphaerales bacterium]|nr:hypothetical protein [Phycisphaerales bacterium]